MTSAVDQLNSMVFSKKRHDIPYEDILPLQIAAANERLQDRRERIPALQSRVKDTGIEEIGSVEDLVPLLFDHTVYKSYDESWYYGGNWEMMTKWVDSVSTHRVEGVVTEGITGLDDWLTRMAAAGHSFAYSSGTSGKFSLLNYSDLDYEMVGDTMVAAFGWTVGVEPGAGYTFIGSGPVPISRRNAAALDAMDIAYGDGKRLAFPGPTISLVTISAMVALRKRIEAGTANPADVAEYEASAAEREAAMERGRAIVIEHLIENRLKKLVIGGGNPDVYVIAEALHERGLKGSDFHPENVLSIGGGLKGTKVRSDYREFMRSVFNVKPRHEYQFYSMQDMVSAFPRCTADRYHIAPWVMFILLDESGKQILTPTKGDQEGRVAFFDFAMDGRWGGLVTGDKVSANFGKCACGHEGPTVAAEMSRYPSSPDGAKVHSTDVFLRGSS